MSWAIHFTDSANPPHINGSVRTNCGRVVPNAVPRDWALVDEAGVCQKCKKHSEADTGDFQWYRYVTFWTTGQEGMDAA